MTQIIIIDVGHGNAAIIESDQVYGVIDAAPGSALLDNLDIMGVKEIEHVFLSHADHDHVGGLTSILLSEDFSVKNIHLNSDSTKLGPHYQDLLAAIEDSVVRNDTNVYHQYAQKLPICMIGSIAVNIIAPQISTILSGAGGRTLSGATITSNSQSAVYLISDKGKDIVLFGGDMDDHSLDFIARTRQDLSVPVLVYPHHGGHVGTAARDIAFAEKISKLFSPKFVLFSTGRRKHKNPLKTVVDKLLECNSELRIVCTQLSQNCSESVPISGNLPPGYSDHLEELPYSSRASQEFCAGTIRIVSTGESVKIDKIHAHSAFVKSFVASPMCRIYSEKN
ncbi:ComEC/Rec2 family competence protein [Deinococcus marmoris]|uniref:ComEC/Rec2 family competence protein n=1 Tax=Deinococcus marmoris TaxID=249408 RepID=UPI0012DE4A1A|nr:MBL fold metallo-hydrolase [Deinococcus marmoris]